MAALKRNRGTWLLILVLGAGLFFLRGRRGMAAGDLTISAATTFSSLDGSAACRLNTGRVVALARRPGDGLRAVR